MSILDQKAPSNWREVVKEMGSEELMRNPIDFLKQKNVEIDSSLAQQVERLKDIDADQNKIEMWNELKALAEGQLTPEERRNVICKLAEAYQGFLGWEGETVDEPGW